MPRHAEFDVPQRNPAAKGPTFTLGDEVFHLLPAMPAGAFMDLPDSLGGQLVVAGHFISGCLVEGEEDRFRDVLRNKSKVYEPVDLMPIVRWLINEAWTEDDAPPPADPTADEAAAETP